MGIRHLLITVLLFGAALSKSLNSAQPKWNNRGQVVFLGDSITDAWDNGGGGLATWNELYVPLGAVNTGVSGDRTSTIIDRINNQGIVDNLNAYLAVLKIGTNDLSGNVPEQTVYENIGTIINLLKAKNPGIKVLLLGVLPRTGSEIHGRIRNVNALISRYADNSEVFFFNMEFQFSTGLGTVIPELFTDGLHLTPLGYTVWAQTMNPLFNFILNMPFYSKAVWLGDSLTDWFQTNGAAVWEETYLPIHSLNVARAGHTSTQTLARIEREGVLNNLNAKVAMLMVGGNDLTGGAQAPSIIANIERIITLIKEKLPHGRILLMGLLPAGGKPPSVIEQGKLVNEALAQMENNDDIRYLDMREQFADEDENIFPELYLADQTHLSLAGYRVWRETMDPLFRELLRFQ